nr:unnamed protein product [Digitaria exilis]
MDGIIGKLVRSLTPRHGADRAFFLVGNRQLSHLCRVGIGNLRAGGWSVVLLWIVHGRAPRHLLLGQFAVEHTARGYVSTPVSEVFFRSGRKRGDWTCRCIVHTSAYYPDQSRPGTNITTFARPENEATRVAQPQYTGMVDHGCVRNMGRLVDMGRRNSICSVEASLGLDYPHLPSFFLPSIYYWREVVRREMDSITANGTWELSELPAGCKPKAKWAEQPSRTPDQAWTEPSGAERLATLAGDGGQRRPISTGAGARPNSTGAWARMDWLYPLQAFKSRGELSLWVRLGWRFLMCSCLLLLLGLDFAVCSGGATLVVLSHALSCVEFVRLLVGLFFVDLGQCTSTPRVAADDVPAGIDSGSVSPSTSRFDDSDIKAVRPAKPKASAAEATAGRSQRSPEAIPPRVQDEAARIGNCDDKVELENPKAQSSGRKVPKFQPNKVSPAMLVAPCPAHDAHLDFVQLRRKNLLLAAAAATTMATPPQNPTTDALRVADLPGRGRGLVAARNVGEGEVLLSESPALLYPSTLASLRSYCAACFRSLPSTPTPCASCRAAAFCSPSCAAASHPGLLCAALSHGAGAGLAAAAPTDAVPPGWHIEWVPSSAEDREE